MNKPNYKHSNFILENMNLKQNNTIQLFGFRSIKSKLGFLQNMDLDLISIQFFRFELDLNLVKFQLFKLG